MQESESKALFVAAKPQVIQTQVLIIVSAGLVPAKEADQPGTLRNKNNGDQVNKNWWFCLASPTFERRFTMMPKGPVHPEEHVLIILYK